MCAARAAAGGTATAKAAQPLLLPQRPRTPLKAGGDLARLLASVALPPWTPAALPAAAPGGGAHGAQITQTTLAGNACAESRGQRGERPRPLRAPRAPARPSAPGASPRPSPRAGAALLAPPCGGTAAAPCGGALQGGAAPAESPGRTRQPRQCPQSLGEDLARLLAATSQPPTPGARAAAAAAGAAGATQLPAPPGLLGPGGAGVAARKPKTTALDVPELLARSPPSPSPSPAAGAGAPEAQAASAASRSARGAASAGPAIDGGRGPRPSRPAAAEAAAAPAAPAASPARAPAAAGSKRRPNARAAAEAFPACGAPSARTSALGGHAAPKALARAEKDQEEDQGQNADQRVGRLHKLALKLRIPLDVMKQAWEVFEELAVPMRKRKPKSTVIPLTFDPFEDGQLTADGFAKVLCKITNVDDPDHLPDGLLHSCFVSADVNASQNLDFHEFALWYSRHGFSEEVLLSPEQRDIRQLARRHGLSIVEVEAYKASFDTFDEDRSGEIEYEEFEKLLYTLIKVPPHLDLPASRVRQFWAETDLDSGGSINFEEFLLFYTRYFAHSLNSDGSPSCPIEAFYRGLRSVPVQRAW